MNSFWNRPSTLLFGSILLFVFVVALDQALKSWAYGLTAPEDVAFIRIIPFENAGVLGGYFSDLHPWIIRIFFAVLFGFLCVGGSLLIHFLRHKPVARLKWGILIYLAGVMGNVWDRITTGRIVDFMIFRLPFLEGMAFNFADLFVFLGFVLVVIAILKDSDAIWFKNDTRQGHWVEPRFQRAFGFLLVLVGLAHFFVIAIYSFAFLRVYVGGDAPTAPDRIILDYLIGLLVLEGGAIIITFGASILFSHRMVGPLIALEKFVERLAESKDGKADTVIRLRRTDYFRDKVEWIAGLISRRWALKPPSGDQNPRE